MYKLFIIGLSFLLCQHAYAQDWYVKSDIQSTVGHMPTQANALPF